MLDKIVDGISIKLNRTFGNEYQIFTEEIKQGLQTPCFFIQPLNPMNIKLVGNRHIRKNAFDIHYFPRSNEPNAECYKMLDTLYLAMEYIKVGGNLQRGTQMHGEVMDGVLHFFVSYDMVVVKKEKQTLMDVVQEHHIKVEG